MTLSLVGRWGRKATGLLRASALHGQAGFAVEEGEWGRRAGCRGRRPEFVMRCWTRDEVQRLLPQAGLVAPDYRGGYDPMVAVGSTDRLVVTGPQP